jgi:hypothetical protein
MHSFEVFVPPEMNLFFARLVVISFEMAYLQERIVGINECPIQDAEM